MIEPARQLGSVAVRYCGPLSSLGTVGWRRFDDRPTQRRATQDAGGKRSRAPELARLEAVLFLAKEPLSVRKLSQYANLADGTQARTLVAQLNELYDRDGSAFRAKAVAGGVQLLTRPQFASWLRRLQHVPSEIRLSAPAMETLAVVAYRQPVLRADIEELRGVACGEILRQLMERNLVRVAGRSDELGRPYLYGTTVRFLQLFGLRDIDDLPRIEMFVQTQSTVPQSPADARQAAPNERNSRVPGDQQKERDSHVNFTTESDELTGHDAPMEIQQIPVDSPSLAKEDSDEWDEEDSWDDEDDDEEDFEYEYDDDDWDEAEEDGDGEEDGTDEDEVDDESEEDEGEDYDYDEEDEWEEVEDEELEDGEGDEEGDVDDLEEEDYDEEDFEEDMDYDEDYDEEEWEED